MALPMGKQKSQQDGSMSNAKTTEVILHRDLSTQSQINMLLGVISTLASVIMVPDGESSFGTAARKPLPGEAKIAAENSFIKSCERLDSIIDTPLRWGIGYQLMLEKQYNERHDESVKLLRMQQETEALRKVSVAAVTAPNFRYKPMLVPLEDGRWMAFLGDTQNLEAGIIGIGDYPAAALKSFDEAFNGNLSPAVQAWLKQHEDNLQNGVETTTPFPEQEPNEHREKIVDPEGDRDAEDPAKPGSNPS